uniref:TPR_REGION domain-containing protein n=1 Tax=Trichobilharzia regenti TaxID=157069 RepID=A0AA85JUH2_TRIRE|nr:unnamed protein product [Trichobilharzia regenti]
MLFILTSLICLYFKIGYFLIFICEFISLKVARLKSTLLSPFNPSNGNSSTQPIDIINARGLNKCELRLEYAISLLKTTNEENVNTAMEIILYILRNNQLTRLQSECLYYLAISCAKLGDYAKAMMYCQHLLTFYPNCDRSNSLLAKIQLRALQDAQDDSTIMKCPKSN